jgi:hypothetical protein
VLRIPRPEGFLLGFAPFTPQQIQEGVDVLATVIEAHVRRPTRTKNADPLVRRDS